MAFKTLSKEEKVKESRSRPPLQTFSTTSLNNGFDELKNKNGSKGKGKVTESVSKRPTLLSKLGGTGF